MKQHSTLLATGILILAVLACKTSGSIGTTPDTGNHKTTEIHLAKDDGSNMPGKETTGFSVSDRTIHCVSTLKEAKEGTKISFGWSAVDVKGMSAQKIKDLDYTTKADENIVHSHLIAPNDWPTGKYKCEISVDGSIDRSVEFNIE